MLAWCGTRTKIGIIPFHVYAALVSQTKHLVLDPSKVEKLLLSKRPRELADLPPLVKELERRNPIKQKRVII